MTAPDWLVRRAGAVKCNGGTCFVLLNQEPNFSVNAVPVDGKFGSVIRQVNSGKRIASQGTFASADEAIAGGLDDLRKALGWA